MNDYKELIAKFRAKKNDGWQKDGSYQEQIITVQDILDAADAIEQLVREINYCPTDTLRKYHAWLLEQFHNNPTSEILHSTDTAIGWLKAYAEYRDINVSFGIGNGEV